MKTVRSLLYRDIVWSVVFVAVAFMSLFFFIDFLDELQRVSQTKGFTAWHAALAALFSLPWRFYELLPIAVLIGTIYAMARLAQSSEFTILRTGGLGPGRALLLLLQLGVVLAVITFLAGEYLAPLGEQQAMNLRLKFSGGQSLGRAGAWLKEHRQDRAVSINVEATNADGLMRNIRIFEHDPQGRLVRQIQATQGRAEPAAGGSVWHLQSVQQTDWPLADGSPLGPVRRAQAQLDWNTTLDEHLVSAALSPMESMTTLELWRYSRHLSTQEQSGQRYEQLLWKRAIYPFACIVMMALALPFAYLHARAGGISLKVFGGIMLGISFVLLNNVAGHLGMLRDWSPWLTAITPSLLYLSLSMAAFSWLVRYR